MFYDYIALIHSSTLIKKWSALPEPLLLPKKVEFAVVAQGNHRVPLSAYRFYRSKIRPLKKKRQFLVLIAHSVFYSFRLHHNSSTLKNIYCLLFLSKKHCSHGQHACLSRWAMFFLMNLGLQPYLTKPHLKSMGKFSHPSKHTSGLSLQPPLLDWVCAKP